MTDIPIVRITLDHMKHTLIHAMGAHFAEMDETVKAAINKAIDEFDYTAAMKQIVNGAIKDTLAVVVQESFGYGSEGYEVIRDFARTALRDRLDRMDQTAELDDNTGSPNG